MPVGWLQLTQNRTRLLAAVAGIAFANLLVFVQLGVVASLTGSVQLTYSPFRADIIISPPSATLFTGARIARRIVYLALSDPNVSDATPLYLGNLEWKRPNGISKTLIVYGIAPEATHFTSPAIASQLEGLKLADRVLLDSQIRDLSDDKSSSSLTNLSPDNPATFEINGKTISAIGTFKLGSGFGSDGALFVSDQTFQRLLHESDTGTPSHVLINVKSGVDQQMAVLELKKRLSSEFVHVRTTAQALADDIAYMNTQVPMGIIFGFGVFIGVLVGIVIVYQVLSADVAAHIREYATFKAMGYTHLFLLTIVMEEAVIVAIIGFFPGIFLGALIYEVMGSATDLPLAMTASRALTVLLGTISACAISGALATIRLRNTDPAELF